HAVLESMLESKRSLPDVFASTDHRKRPVSSHHSIQAGSFDELHDQKVRVAGLLSVVSRDNVRMEETGGAAHFTAKALHHGRIAHEAAADDLQGHGSFHELVFCLVDHAHSTGAEHAEDSVARVID